MCGRYVVKNPVTKTNKLVKSAIQVEDTENYNAHPYQKLPVIKKYKNGNTLENLQWGLVPSCLLYTSPSPRDAHESRMPSSA